MKNRTGFGWIELALGVMMIYLGVMSFLKPNATITYLIIVYAIAAIITGICDLVFYIKTERYTGFGPVLSLVGGIVSVMTGMMLVIHPAAGEWVIYLLFPMWFIAHNISNLANLNTLRMVSGEFNYYFSLLTSVVGLVLGFLMIIHPFITLYTVSGIIGFYLIVTGVNCIVTALGGAGSK